jgi:hypothetical protein
VLGDQGPSAPPAGVVRCSGRANTMCDIRAAGCRVARCHGIENDYTVIAVRTWRGPLLDHLVFFPTHDEVEELANGCRPFEVFRVRHANRIDDLRVRRVSEDWTRCIDLRVGRDLLFAGMNSTGRNEVRRADKLESRLELRRNDARSQADFFHLLSRFISLSHYTHPLSQHRYHQYLEVADVGVAYVDDIPVVGHLLLPDINTRCVRLTFSASIRILGGPKQNLIGQVNRWLHWQEFLWYLSAGYATYDWGGANLNSGIGAFKRTFGGEMRMGWNGLVAGALARPALAIAEASRRRAVQVRKRGRALAARP